MQREAREVRQVVPLGLLRSFSVAAALATTLGVSITGAERAWECAAFAGSVGLAWIIYLRCFWSNARALLVASSLLVCVGVFAIAGESLVTLEEVIGFRITGKLELSPRLRQWIADRVSQRSNVFEQFGVDPMFYRRQPGSLYRARGDYRNYGPEYISVADDVGFINPDTAFYNRHKAIDLFIAGGSVLEGIGGPGVIEELRALLGSRVYSLAVGSYSPRQKVEALQNFAMPKSPKWIVVEFAAATDVSTIIEDEICEKLKSNFECRFDFPLIGAGLSKDPAYAGLGWYGDFGPVMRVVRNLRSNSLTLALGTAIAMKARRHIAALTGERRVAQFNDEAITFPGVVHFDIYPERHLDWVRVGLNKTLKVYEELIRDTVGTGVGIMILYNPTSYEIYREFLPEATIDPRFDDISTLQRSTLAAYAHEKRIAFCDLTEGFRKRVGEGTHGLFGRHDGTHWTETGRKVAAGLIAECLRVHTGT